MNVRRRGLAMLGRVPPAAQAIRILGGRLAARRGADRALIGHIERAELPLERSLQALKWAQAVAGVGDPPRHFQPGDHFADPAARACAAQLAAESNDPRFVAAAIGVDDRLALDELAALVHADLEAALSEAAAAPMQRPGVDPATQRHVVRQVTDALEAHTIRPFLMSGSLLGIVRDGEFMAHDYDVDLGLLPEADVATVSLALESLPNAEVERVDRRFVVRLDGIIADVFEHDERDGRWWHSTPVHEWWNSPFQLVREDRTGDGFWIPDEPERYLTENYGDWTRPVPFYEISFDTPNRVYRNEPAALRFLHSRVRIGLRTNDRWLVESAVRELRDHFGVDVVGQLGSSRLID